MLSLIFFWLHCTGYGILVPWTGIEPVPLTLEAQSVNHWADREVPVIFYFNHSDRCVVMSHWFKFSLLSWLRMLNTFSCHLYILFSEISLIKHYTFLFGLYAFILLIFVSSYIYILSISSLSDTWLANILSYPIACFFLIFLVEALQVKFFHFDEFWFISSSFYGLCFWC